MLLQSLRKGSGSGPNGLRTKSGKLLERPSRLGRNFDGSEPGDTDSAASVGDASESQADAALNALATKTANEGVDVDGRLRLWAEHGLFLCIKLVKGRNLGVFDLETSSSDPWARMKLLSSHKSVLKERAALPGAEYRTRTIHRNLAPYWDEGLIVPITKDINSKTIFNLQLYDADLLEDEFMGRLNITLDQLLYSLHGQESLCHWFALRAPKQAVKRDNANQEGQGELLIETELLTANQAQMRMTVQEELKSPEYLRYRFGPKYLTLDLKRLIISRHGRASIDHLLAKLSVEVRVGGTIVAKPVRHQNMVKRGPAGLDLVLEFDSDKVLVPMKDAFSGSFWSWNNKARSEVADIRVYVCSASEQLTKTQVPIWVVPTCDADPESDEAPKPIRLSRLMQLYSTRPLISGCEIEMDLGIVPAQAVESKPGEPQAQGGVAVDAFEDDEDERGAPPFSKAPSPLPTMVLEQTFNCGPSKLYQLVVKGGSVVAGQVQAQENLTKFTVGPWQAEGGVRKRTIKYTKPLMIPVPFAPKECDVTEVHTLHVKEVSGWVLQIQISTDAPKGELFVVTQQVVGQRGAAPNQSSLQVSMEVNFLKSPGFLKGTITSNSTKDTVAHWEAMAQALSAHIDNFGNPEATAAATTQPTHVHTATVAHSRSSLEVWAPLISQALLLLLLLGALLCVTSGARCIITLMEQLVAQLNGLSDGLARIQDAQRKAAQGAASMQAEGGVCGGSAL